MAPADDIEQKQEDTDQPTRPLEPRGFGEHTRGLSSEYAHEQGWGLEEEQRTKLPSGPQDTDGGTDYEYGARDFGDEAVNTAVGRTPEPEASKEVSSGPQDAGKLKKHGDPLADAFGEGGAATEDQD